MLSDSDIIAQFYGKAGDGNGHKAISESGLAKQKREDDINRAFYHGDKAEYTHEMSVDNQKLMVCFNRVKPYIHSFAGFAAQHRRLPEYFAIESDDQRRVLYTETANKWLSSLRSTANADQIETQQDKELAICGYGSISPSEDYMRNPDGEIALVECTRDFWWDPTACAPGMDDRRWEFLKKKIHIDVALKMYGGTEEDYTSAKPAEYGPFEYYPKGGSYDKIAYDWVGTQEAGMVYVYEYHWYDIEPYWRIVNPIFEEENQLNGKASIILDALDRMKSIRLAEEESEDLFTFNPRSRVLALTKEQFEDVTAIFDMLNVEYDYDENLRKVFCEAIISGSKVFKKRKSVDQSGFAIKVKTADYDYRNKIWVGMVTSLREPAKYANKAVTEFLLILAATGKPGYFYNINAVPDPAKFEQQASRNAKAIAVNDINGIRDKQQPAMQNGYDALYPMFLQALSEVIGFAPEAMGMGDVSQPSFELEQQRIKQVMTTLAVYFDAITLYQKEHARSMLYFMRRLAKNNEGRLVPMVDDDGARGVAQVFSDMIADEYVIDIGEAPDTPTKKKEQSAIMTNYVDKVLLAAPDKAKEALALNAEYLPISSAEKAKWKKLFAPEPTPEQMQAAQKEQALREADAMAELDKKQSDANLKKAQTQKTLAEIPRTEAESDQKNLENIALSTNPIHRLNMTI